VTQARGTKQTWSVEVTAAHCLAELRVLSLLHGSKPAQTHTCSLLSRNRSQNPRSVWCGLHRRKLALVMRA